MYYVLMLAVMAIDQIVKAIVDAGMAVGQSIPVVRDIFCITYVQNTGVAFSMFAGRKLLITLIAAAVLAALLVYFIVKCRDSHKTLKFALALMVSGGFANIIDRLARGYVVDFLDFRVWPVFNIADIAVCVGCALLIIYVIFFDKKKD